MTQVDLSDKEDNSLETYKGYWRNTSLWPEGIGYGGLRHPSEQQARKVHEEKMKDGNPYLQQYINGRVRDILKETLIAYLGPIPCK